METKFVRRSELDKNVAFLDCAFTPGVNVILLKVATTYYAKAYATTEELDKDAFKFLEETIDRLPRSINTIVTDCSISMTPQILTLLNSEFEHVLKRHPRAHTTERILQLIIKG